MVLKNTTILSQVNIDPNSNPKSNPNSNNGYPDVSAPIEFGVIFILMAVLLKSFITPALKRLREYIDEPEYDSKDIQALILQILVISKSDRVAVCLFHNGEKFANGEHFRKLTMAYEVVKDGVSRISKEFRAVTVSSILDFLEKVRLSDSLIHLEANAKYDSLFSDYLAIAGAEAVITTLIKNKEQKEIGLLFIFYTHSTPSQTALKLISESEEFNRLLTRLKTEITSAKKNRAAALLLSKGLHILGIH